MTRTFIALELDEALQHYLSGTIRQVAAELPRLSWVNPSGIHLTLAFLGELSDEQLTQASQAAASAAQNGAPFDYRLSHLGIFGSPRQPRVLWVGIEDPSGSLQSLHNALRVELVQRGFEVDTRPFSPHLTLARIKAPLQAEEQQRLQRILHTRQFSSSSALHHVQQLSVMKSELARTGAKYTCLRNYQLALK
ncbi:MAG: RNA 2',3'-cyclic phosphodiesterase [Ktedonobacteraceae bacterium]